MRFGTCVGFDKLESAAKLGYDYLESNLGHIKSLGEQELKYKSNARRLRCKS